MGRTLRNFENKPLTQNNDIVGVYNARKNSFEQFTDYYPYGLQHASARAEGVNRRKFGGKEMMSDHGYNSYDFAARHQNPAFPHFTTPDPLAEKFKHLSPHLFCAGDPINHIDPTGMDYLIRVDETTITIKANIYTVANSLESAKFAAKQWNDLSNKYEMDGKIIKFEINVILIDPDSTHYKNTTKNKEEKALTYMASIDQNSIGNVFLISTDFDDNTNGSNMGGVIS